MKISPREPTHCSGSAYLNRSKLETVLGKEFLDRIRGKVIIDFGCGEGMEAIELAQRGALLVIGIDNREDVLNEARQRANQSGCREICCFAAETTQPADVIVSIDSFEHFEDPAQVLREMDKLLRPDGEVIASFGPTWYHPLGGHLFSVFPWAHLLFSESALIRWRSNFKTDGATRFSETAGGLNQMTIRRFEKLVEQSPFQFASLELVPIRKLRYFHNRSTREFTTAMVRCCLRKR
jgi:SAM-dependent methyltransferase